MKEHDADRIIKSSVIKCLGPLLDKYLNLLDEQSENSLLKAILDKLRVEIDKSLILAQITHISNEYEIKRSQNNIFKELLDVAS